MEAPAMDMTNMHLPAHPSAGGNIFSIDVNTPRAFMSLIGMPFLRFLAKHNAQFRGHPRVEGGRDL
ncbi:hypothetical protein FIBSPDRAFT_874113 [Athelia psychrophila]|uniref:Uncharacterized protein n=1 Tax=Athelia psychrophila TaxID=1759441 RepID=A0A165XSS4_9AGAM|nr:hypothetical protein FIBSPDRAFT_874113 [Fibularhizoctonia sp. CBS 109695]